jgi:hypothetical protein
MSGREEPGGSGQERCLAPAPGGDRRAGMAARGWNGGRWLRDRAKQQPHEQGYPLSGLENGKLGTDRLGKNRLENGKPKKN